MNVIVILALFMQSGDVTQKAPRKPDRNPSPNQEQYSQMAKLIRTAEDLDYALKAESEKLQRELTEAYSGFHLDEAEIKKIHEQIVATQKKLLMNYHTLQVGYRRIMGFKAFPGVKRRIEEYIWTEKGRRKRAEKRANAKKMFCHQLSIL